MDDSIEIRELVRQGDRESKERFIQNILNLLNDQELQELLDADELEPVYDRVTVI